MNSDTIPSVKSLSVSVVIRTLNEETTLEDVIRRCRPFATEILVIDGHSTDQTITIAERCGARVAFDNGCGKGAAIRQSVELVHGTIIVFIDADGSHIPEDIPTLIGPIVADTADHVTASRLIGGSSELHGGFDEFFRLAGSAFITACINWRYNVRLSDSQNGFRAIRRDTFRSLGLTSNCTTIEQEMIMRTLAQGSRMAEVPSHEHTRQGGVTKVHLIRVWHIYLLSLIKGLFFLRRTPQALTTQQNTVNSRQALL